MDTVTPEVVDKIADAIRRAVSPVRIILFGSYTRGEAGPDSDLDFLVIEDEPFGPGRSRYREMDRLRRAADVATVPMDILVFSSDEVEKWKDTVNHVVREALHEGKILYERS